MSQFRNSSVPNSAIAQASGKACAQASDQASGQPAGQASFQAHGGVGALRLPKVRRRRAPAPPRLILALVLTIAALAQTASEKPSVDVRRVGSRIACQCGCKDSVATCSMLECHFSKPAKERIAQMQALGMSDDQIIQAFVRDYGAIVYLAYPNAFGWIIPYATLGLGLVVIFLFVKKYRKPRPIAEVGPIEIDDPALDKYKDQIEKDLANLE